MAALLSIPSYEVDSIYSYKIDNSSVSNYCVCVLFSHTVQHSYMIISLDARWICLTEMVQVGTHGHETGSFGGSCNCLCIFLSYMGISLGTRWSCLIWMYLDT